jgi:hypothetical protein
MGRRKGELTSAGIDRGWPHQVALRSEVSIRDHKAIHAFCRDLSLAPMGHSVVDEGEWWNVYCFAVPEHADEFQARYKGEKFNPADRGRGADWARWRK